MKGNTEEFLECLHFPWIERINFETLVHFINEIFDEQFTSCWIQIRLPIIFRMVFPWTEYLEFNFQTFYYIRCDT